MRKSSSKAVASTLLLMLAVAMFGLAGAKAATTPKKLVPALRKPPKLSLVATIPLSPAKPPVPTKPKPTTLKPLVKPPVKPVIKPVVKPTPKPPVNLLPKKITKPSTPVKK